MVGFVKTLRLPILGALILAALGLGCASGINREKYYRPIEADLRAGNTAAAVDAIEKARQEGTYKEKDRFLYYLDAGLAYHYAGQWDSSNIRLTDAENTAEQLFTKSISKGILANTLLNDNVIEYPGEDFEVLYTNLIKAVNYLQLDQFDGAFVEVRRVHTKLNLLEQKYGEAAEELNRRAREDTSGVYVRYEVSDIPFNSSAFARYLSMHMYAADGLYDDARIDYDAFYKAFELQPAIYDFPPPDIVYDAGDSAILSVVGLVGLAPIKTALNLRIRTDENLDLLTVIYDDNRPEGAVFANYPLPDGVGDFYAKLALPQLTPRGSEIAAVRVLADSTLLGEMQLAEDINRVAEATYKTRQSMVLWRTVLRVVLKTFTASKVKNAVDNGGLGGWLAKLATDVVYDLSEQTDLRGGMLLPGRIYVGDFVVPPGTYDLTVEYLDANGHLVERRYVPNVEARSFDFNLVRSFCLR